MMKTKQKHIISYHQFPSPFKDLLGVFNLFSFDFLSLECFQEAADRYYTNVILWSIVPLVFALLILVTYLWRALVTCCCLTKASVSAAAVVQLQQQQDQATHRIYVQHVWMFLVLSYVVLPPVAQKQFQSLDCIPFPHNGDSFLRVDTSIDCNGEDYLKFRNYMFYVIALYQMIPVLWLVLLLNKRCKINPAVSATDPKLALYIRDKDAALSPIRFLFDSYTVQKWWFEVAEMYRRILFVSIIPLSSNIKATRASLGCILGVLSMIYFRAENPFRREFNNIIAYVAQTAIFITFYAALSIETGVMIDFGLSAAGMGIFLVITNISVFALMLYYAVIRLQAETEEQNQRHAKVI
jgi:hypothetical protein